MKNRLKNPKLTWQNMMVFAIALVAAYFLKRHYSMASSDDILWILGPTSYLVELLTGLKFILESGAGYVNHDVMIVIAKSCSGINFLIICFCMACYFILPKYRSILTKSAALCSIALGAYMATLVANTVRIIIAIHLYSAQHILEWVSARRIHHLEGTVVYFVFLLLTHLMVSKYVVQKA